MANRQIVGLTAKVAERTDVLPIQDAAGAAEAKKESIGDLLGLALSTDISDSTADGRALLTSADANPFTDADEAKLDGIEASADVTDEANVISALSGATLTDIGTPASTDRVLVQDASDANNLKYAAFSTFGGGGGGGISWSTPVDAVITPDGSKTRDIGTDTALFRNVWVEHIQQKHSATNAWEMGSRPIDNYDVVLFAGKTIGNQFALDLMPAAAPADPNQQAAWIDICRMPIDNTSAVYQALTLSIGENKAVVGIGSGNQGTYPGIPLEMRFKSISIWGCPNVTPNEYYKYWTLEPQSLIGYDVNSSITEWVKLNPTEFRIRANSIIKWSSTSTGNINGFSTDVGLTRHAAGIVQVNGGTFAGFASVLKGLMAGTYHFGAQTSSTEPADPAAGYSVMWMSTGSGLGDAGDIMFKINIGGVVKTITLVDYSAF